MYTALRLQLREVTDAQRRELKEAFQLFDADRTGALDLHELKVLIRALGFAIKKGEVVRLVHDVDPSNEGFVTVSQLIDVMAILYSNRDPETEVTEAFKLFDDDGTGQITLNNMRRVARELGETLTDKELQQMMDVFDKNQDSEIDLDEFKLIMANSNAM
eukprot:16706-Heterococcus_DN1.PRE.1